VVRLSGPYKLPGYLLLIAISTGCSCCPLALRLLNDWRREPSGHLACLKIAHKHLTPKLPAVDAYTAAEEKD
jgi:hypothetical protein